MGYRKVCALWEAKESYISKLLLLKEKDRGSWNPQWHDETRVHHFTPQTKSRHALHV